jgi:transketolase
MRNDRYTGHSVTAHAHSSDLASGPGDGGEAEASEGVFPVVRMGKTGVVIAVDPLLDEVLNAVESLDVTVLHAPTTIPFDAVGVRTAVLAAEHADVVLVEPDPRGTSARQVADTLIHVPHRLLVLDGRDIPHTGPASGQDAAADPNEPDNTAISAAIRAFLH